MKSLYIVFLIFLCAVVSSETETGDEPEYLFPTGDEHRDFADDTQAELNNFLAKTREGPELRDYSHAIYQPHKATNSKSAEEMLSELEELGKRMDAIFQKALDIDAETAAKAVAVHAILIEEADVVQKRCLEDTIYHIKRCTEGLEKIIAGEDTGIHLL